MHQDPRPKTPTLNTPTTRSDLLRVSLVALTYAYSLAFQRVRTTYYLQRTPARSTQWPSPSFLMLSRSVFSSQSFLVRSLSLERERNPIDASLSLSRQQPSTARLTSYAPMSLILPPPLQPCTVSFGTVLWGSWGRESAQKCLEFYRYRYPRFRQYYIPSTLLCVVGVHQCQGSSPTQYLGSLSSISTTVYCMYYSLRLSRSANGSWLVARGVRRTELYEPND